VDRLDHLVDLGVNALYHTPIFPAESNHRYDAASFDHVDALLGGDEAYRRLIEAAHARHPRDRRSHHQPFRRRP
jgi:alpha-glucosidase